MAMDNQLPPIEIPRVEVLPVLPPRQHDVRAFADYLLTKLLSHEAGLLHSDFREDNGRWYVRGWTRTESFPDQVVAENENVGIFRAVLARFGLHYLGAQLYGGYVERTVSQGNRTHLIAIYMANDQWRGYWLRAFARRL